MPSKSRIQLRSALQDVDANVAHAKSFTRGRKGAPPASAGLAKPGRPFLRGGVVLLGAAVEAYAEGLAKEVGQLTLTKTQESDVKEMIRFSHGASARHIHQLLAPLGLPFVLDDISWQRFPKGKAREVLDELATARNKIAHGAAPKTRSWLVDLERWQKLVPKIADQLDQAAAAHVESVTGQAPW